MALYGLSVASVWANVPQVGSPFPALVDYTIFRLWAFVPSDARMPVTALTFVGPLVTPLAFLAWTRLGRLGVLVPGRSKFGFLILAALGAWWLRVGVPYGRKYQPDGFVVFVICLNIAFWAVMLAAYFRNRSRPSFASNLFWHAVAFAWLGCGAFPYMGELP